MLERVVPVVADTTDGIGLAIARLPAGRRTATMLNGFGDAARIEAQTRGTSN